MLFISMIFYITFACVNGVLTFPDSQGYINMDMHREPFYPLFLALIRFLFKGFGVLCSDCASCFDGFGGMEFG